MTDGNDGYLDEYGKFHKHEVTILDGCKLTTLTMEDVQEFIDHMVRRDIKDGEIHACDFAPGVRQYVDQHNRAGIMGQHNKGFLHLQEMEDLFSEEESDA